MLAKVETAAVVGLSAVPVTAEVDVADGLPGITIVGLPDATVRESKERIRSAIKNSQFAWPQTRVTVNLAPADVRKEGSAFDLPVALGLLAASNQLESAALPDVVALGELALDGTLRPVPGILAVALALRGSGKRLLIPAANGREAAIVGDLEVYALEHLRQAVDFLRGVQKLELVRWGPPPIGSSLQVDGDLADVKGQSVAKRALEVAVISGVDIFPNPMLPYELSPMVTYFTTLLIHPTYGIRKILSEKPSFKRIVLFLFLISTLRGIVEGIWVLLRAGQLGQAVTSWVLLKSYLTLGIPFLLSSLTCGYVRWVGFALVPCLLGRFFARQGRFEDWLRLSGVSMGLYLLAILPNFAYLFFPLPVIRFQISTIYNPGMGIGQVVTSVWLTVILYQAARILCQLPRSTALVVGLSVPLLNVGALVLGSMIFFNLSSLGVLPFRGAMNLATWIFILITLLTIPVFLWSGYRLDRRAQPLARRI